MILHIWQATAPHILQRPYIDVWTLITYATIFAALVACEVFLKNGQITVLCLAGLHREGDRLIILIQYLPAELVSVWLKPGVNWLCPIRYARVCQGLRFSGSSQSRV